jgi:hypothetical protein
MSKQLEKIVEMLSRHRLAENISSGRNSQREEVVTTLLHRQHLAELHNYLVQLGTEEISAPMATSNSPTFGQSNSPRQDG